MQTMADAAFDIAVDSVGLNLSQYDNDGNGYVRHHCR